MSDLKQRIDDLAELMTEFHLTEASIEGEGYRVAFRRRPSAAPAPHEEPVREGTDQPYEPPAATPEPAPKGQAVTSPMTGIFYASPSPSAKPFVKVGEAVTMGQVIALIEAMKVFNEITAPVSGTLLELVAAPGAVVQPGDVLLRIG